MNSFIYNSGEAELNNFLENYNFIKSILKVIFRWTFLYSRCYVEYFKFIVIHLS